MGAVIGNHLLDRDIRLLKGSVGQILVADGPLKDVVVMLARAVRAGHLAGEIFA